MDRQMDRQADEQKTMILSDLLYNRGPKILSKA